jgi:hypothetical protein
MGHRHEHLDENMRKHILKWIARKFAGQDDAYVGATAFRLTSNKEDT